MRILPHDLKDISEIRLSFRGVITILLLTAAFLACFFYMPERIRYVLFAGTAVTIIFFLKPKPDFWLPVLPFLFLAGVTTLPSGDFNPAIATLIMFGYVFVYTADRILWNKPLFIPSKTLFFLLLAFLIQIVSVFISIHIHGQYLWNAIRDGSSIFLFFPFAIIVPNLCRTEERINGLLRTLLLALIVVGFVGVLQYFSITGFSRVDMNLGYVYRGRVTSFFGNPNIFAGYLELSIPMGIALFFKEKDIRWKMTAAVAVILGLLSVLYTFSRGGLLCIFIGCGITSMYIFRSKIWIPIMLGIASVLILISFSGTFERQMSFFMDPKAHLSQPTILHRYVLYRGCLHQFEESPITGVGWGAKEFFWGRSRLYSFWEVRHCVSTARQELFGGLNSVFLNQAVKGGVVALSSLLLIFGTILATGIKAVREGKGILAVALSAGIFSFMIHQLFGNQMKYPSVNSEFWIITGLLIAITYSEQRKKSS